MFAILFFIESLLPRTSRQIFCYSEVVSQQFSSASLEFKRHFAEHAERHFAKITSSRQNGGVSKEEEQDEVRQDGHAYLNYERNVQHTLLTDDDEVSSNPGCVLLDSKIYPCYGFKICK